ncbi:MAG: hydrogenase maturation protease [Methanocellales archaeon]|nr:hydrogenase maturation protease [Methanocellales archaeon]
MKVVILCCGNILAADDGFGIHVLDELRKRNLPKNVELIDGGTGGLDILNYIENADKVIIVDAVSSGGEVGTIHRFTRGDLPEPDSVYFSLHDLGLIEAIRAGEATMPASMPDDIIIIGVEVERVEQFNIGLTPEVDKAMPKVVKMVLDEINTLS